MKSFKSQLLWDAVLVVGAPLLLAAVECFHPHPHDLLALDQRRWLAIHYAQTPLFPLSALAVAALVRGVADVAAGLCRAAMFVFAISYTAFDTAAGVVTGILIKRAHESNAPEAWRAAIEAIWQHSIMGGSGSPFLAVLGAVALAVGTVTCAISLKRAGRPWPPVILLAAAGFGLCIFKTHAWPGGPLTFGGIAPSGGWLLWKGCRPNLSSGPPKPQSP